MWIINGVTRRCSPRNDIAVSTSFNGDLMADVIDSKDIGRFCLFSDTGKSDVRVTWKVR